MSTNAEIGARVKGALGGHTQAWLAEQIGLTADTMSRSLNGHRGFSSVEIAAIADLLDADVHWLITGDRDPLRVSIAARHDYDPGTGGRSNPGRETDERELQSVALAYRQAYPRTDHPTAPIPTTAAGLRGALGEDFVPVFASRLEERLDVDVVRVQHLSTAYSFTLGGRMVILLPANVNWWRSNFDLAHEVAHLALGHHEVETSSEVDERELAANQFASELLMPETLIRSLAWDTITCPEVGQFLWDQGVGTTALRHRLDSLGLRTSSEVSEMLSRPMPGALRPWQHELDLPRPEGTGFFAALFDPIDKRMQDASQRRFPLTLITAHRRRVENEGLTPETLAWMLESPVEELVGEPQPAGSIEDLLEAFAG
ncbi:helix-turn-helix domain-containing protein [Aeromicrobium ginsengisoli]|nr:XRE family transcriptional regulator [Aeromicrobium ginsengisoli]